MKLSDFAISKNCLVTPWGWVVVYLLIGISKNQSNSCGANSVRTWKIKKKKKILTKPQFYSFISRSGRNHRLFIAENGFSHVSLIWRVFSKFIFDQFLTNFYSEIVETFQFSRFFSQSQVNLTTSSQFISNWFLFISRFSPNKSIWRVF